MSAAPVVLIPFVVRRALLLLDKNFLPDSCGKLPAVIDADMNNGYFGGRHGGMLIWSASELTASW
jgi:hypothetical protein